MPESGKLPKYNQIWIYDSEEQNLIRNVIMGKLDTHISSDIQIALTECNPFVAMFRNHREQTERIGDSELKMVIRETPSNDSRRYNAQSASEIAAILPGSGSSESSSGRDIVLHTRNGSLQRINDLNGAYDPLHYILFFPNGDAGFHLNIAYNKPTAVRKNLTPSDFYKYRLVTRRESNSLIHYVFGGPICKNRAKSSILYQNPSEGN
jgi:hypothetical protein